MKVDLDLTWAIFWIAVASVLIAAMVIGSSYESAEKRCVQKNGIPIKDSFGRMTDCKIYLNQHEQE